MKRFDHALTSFYARWNFQVNEEIQWFVSKRSSSSQERLIMPHSLRQMKVNWIITYHCFDFVNCTGFDQIYKWVYIINSSARNHSVHCNLRLYDWWTCLMDYVMDYFNGANGFDLSPSPPLDLKLCTIQQFDVLKKKDHPYGQQKSTMW